ncbi:serine hydrolase domain-containing protein [Roseateles violae]|uniref:Serine hydrolase domain-containing protein n=1 Tax=Roseateles violae TaxID=3058042 RepID=A0ABT8DV98_9BURK|nr:serine hydrolase domain-containing protein [Pelomonas sp. PFR6]MDN3922132.1 serine hydrolase domain-containing protein [Pelomonas sp. PFR6]
MNESSADQSGIAALDELFQPLKRSDAPGIVVGVARQGRPVYRRGFGLASIEHGVANTPATRMRIGSTSKHFASLATLLLAEEGKLDLDVGVRRYLPELPELPALGVEPTLRQFMNHTSGLRDYLDASFIACGMTITPKGSALAAQVRQSEANFAPGEKMIYNNGGYQLLSLVIERVAGLPFERFLQERIFAPLGMLDTQSVQSDFEIHRGVATLHVPQPDGSYRRGMFPSEEVRGEGAIVSTIDDMLRWLAHLRGPHKIGSEDSWAQLLRPARLNNGFLSKYGLGLQIEQYRGVDVIHHGGTVIGGNCQMLTVPAHALDIIIISNGAAVSVNELANKVVEAMLGEAAFPLPAEKTAASADYQALVGSFYASPATGMVFGFGDAGGKLGFVVHNSPPIPARDEGDALCLDFSRIVTGPYRVAIGPLAAGESAPPTLQLDDGGTPQRLERLQAPPLAEIGPALLGHYRVPDLNAQARIEFEGEALIVRIASEFGPNRLTLKPLSDELFAWNFGGQLAALGGTLRVERDEAGQVSGLRFNTLRTRNLHFQRIAD